MKSTIAATAVGLAVVAAFVVADPRTDPLIETVRPRDHLSPSEIERRLSGPEAGPTAARAAFAACRSIAESFDGRDVPRFLEQYGRAAARSGEPEVAAVMLARCFVLHPASRWAPSSLLESATLHRHAFGDEDAAQRLARRSLATARALGLREAIAAAEAFLAASESTGADPPEASSPIPNTTIRTDSP